MSTVRWATPERHESVGSTNAEALADPRPGRVVVADHQSAGQGRRGRAWTSAPGTGMAISAVVPPVPPALSGWVPLATGLALALSLEDSRWRVPAVLKWPNDVLVPLPPGEGEPVLEADGRHWGKVAGILCQAAATDAIVVGTGVNVDHTADQLPVRSATSWRLARGGAPLPDQAREDLLTSYLAHLARGVEHLLDGDAGPVRTAYLDRCLTVGRAVLVHRPDGGTTAGTASGVGPTGALLVDGLEGRSTHHAGDVVHARPR